MIRFNWAGLVLLASGTWVGCGGSVNDTANGPGGTTGVASTTESTGGKSVPPFPPNTSNGTGGVATCLAGAETCACLSDGTCSNGLVCASHVCVRLGTGGASATGGVSSVAGSTAAGVGGLGGGKTSGGNSGIGGIATSGGSTGTVAAGGQGACTGMSPGSSYAWAGPPGCGDGKVNQTSEQCDDGNTLAGDGCDGLCQVEPNHTCPPQGGACVMTFVCGDGVVNPGEQCDQGTYQGNLGCSADCKTQDPGYKCVPGQACVALFLCGNGRIEPGETCDPPNPGNGCSSFCQTESGWRCAPGSCTKLPWCGDGIIQAALGEKCDQGTFQGSPGCAADCRSMDSNCTCTPGKQCVCNVTTCDAGVCQYAGSCPAGCGPAPRCGDGLVQLDYGEECDDGVNSGAYGTCMPQCKLAAFCGDGVVNGDSAHPEACDDGINDGTYGTCSPGCTPPPRCGDGIVQINWGEQCEPNSSDDPNCTADCKLPGYCGDGVVQTDLGEQCDDGVAMNTGGYGGCNANCTLAPYCGDGVANGPEQCDFGTVLNVGDYGGCTSQCTLAPYCGDGIVQSPYEECDMGTCASLDERCTSSCKIFEFAGP